MSQMRDESTEHVKRELKQNKNVKLSFQAPTHFFTFSL